MRGTPPGRCDRTACDRIRSSLDDFLDGELPPLEAARIARLAGDCDTCAAIVRHEHAVLQQVRAAVRAYEVPSWLGARVSAALAFSLTTPDRRW